MRAARWIAPEHRPGWPRLLGTLRPVQANGFSVSLLVIPVEDCARILRPRLGVVVPCRGVTRSFEIGRTVVNGFFAHANHDPGTRGKIFSEGRDRLAIEKA